RLSCFRDSVFGLSLGILSLCLCGSVRASLLQRGVVGDGVSPVTWQREDKAMNRVRILRAGWFAGGVLATLVSLALLAGTGSRSEDGGQPAPKPKQPGPAAVEGDGKLRIIAFGAHPDDCELRASGVAAKWAALGHHVKFVSVTNGDIGHWKSAGGPLALRRAKEVQKCAQILGIHAQVLDIHDGELLPTLEHRKTITRLIREWKADIVM